MLLLTRDSCNQRDALETYEKLYIEQPGPNHHPHTFPRMQLFRKAFLFVFSSATSFMMQDQVAHSTEALKKHEEFLHPDKNTPLIPLMFRSPLHNVLFIYLFCPERFDSQTGLDRLNGTRSSVCRSRPTPSSHYPFEGFFL